MRAEMQLSHMNLQTSLTTELFFLFLLSAKYGVVFFSFAKIGQIGLFLLFFSSGAVDPSQFNRQTVIGLDCLFTPQRLQGFGSARQLVGLSALEAAACVFSSVTLELI